MKITKYMEGHYVELIIEKIRDYARYGLYQVYSVVDGVKKPLYKECFSDHQICEIINNRYSIRMEWHG